MAELKVGLEGIAVAKTAISYADGEKGELIYRGQWVENLAKHHSYEDVVHLLWYGHLPSAEESQKFKKALASHREIPNYLKEIIKNLPKKLSPMAVLRTAISALELSGEDWPPTIEQATQVLAKAPTIICYYYNLIHGKKEIHPDPNLSHAENFLYMLFGKKPEAFRAKTLETYWILSADHDMNASTFTARVVTSTRSDYISAITAAIGALIGPLHGGAPSFVDEMLESIKTEANAETWLRKQLEGGERLMGFGHRVYKTYDPRSAALREIVKQYADADHFFKLSLHVEKVATELLKEYKPGKNLYPNLEFWAAAVFRAVQMPADLYTISFCLSRIAGWSAHIFEQANDNRLIRPSGMYDGPQPEGKREKFT